MALSIRNGRVEELARQLARERGESLTEVILEALEARAAEPGPRGRSDRDLASIQGAQARIALLPDLDSRAAEDLIGYDENGLPS